ncbi:MAG: phosphate ABC transporter substrate-binding protein [Christensenellaceae bacterium]|nr:phosphate ABC transporter substrate-binding protein [Christensenellaceae bacterium]
MKKILSVVLSVMMIITAVSALAFDAAGDITVISREDGSGTRGAFVELTGVEAKDADGNKVDHTTLDAEIVNGTSTVLTSVAADVQAIGYISMGSLNDTVKGVKIEGAEPTAENVVAGTYPIFRPFNLAFLGSVEEKSVVVQDFVKFILSDQGQKVVEEAGYIAVGDKPAYETMEGAEGKIVVGGSSSVTPVMEKLAEAYKAINDKVEIEIQLSDSSTGVTSAIDGVLDIGMASRALKDSELEKGVTPLVIANDGIALIVNLENTCDDLTVEQVRQIYVGEITSWGELAN